jgi:hypothetical protein
MAQTETEKGTETEIEKYKCIQPEKTETNNESIS